MPFQAGERAVPAHRMEFGLHRRKAISQSLLANAARRELRVMYVRADLPADMLRNIAH